MFIKTKNYSAVITQDYIYPTSFSRPANFTKDLEKKYYDKIFCEDKYMIFSDIVFLTLENYPEMIDFYKDEWILYRLGREGHSVLFILSPNARGGPVFEKKIVDSNDVKMDYTDLVEVYKAKPTSGSYLHLLNSNSYISNTITNIALEQRLVVSKYKYRYGILSATQNLLDLVKNDIIQSNKHITIKGKRFTFNNRTWN